MRKKLVVGNWKMNLSQAEAVSLAHGVLGSVGETVNVDVAVCPTFLTLSKVADVLRGSQIGLGAQNCFWLPKGAFTGQISALMLSEFGVSTCIVGHSETRGRFGKLEIDEEAVSLFSESNFTVNLKIKSLLELGITPILCVGETLEERQSHQTDETIGQQIRACLAGIEVEELFSAVIAYEPVWAIGTGRVCEPEEASRVCGLIRKTVEELYGPELAEEIRVLYGGSVKGSNARALFNAENIDGGLIGGAALVADEFQRVVLSAS